MSAFSRIVVVALIPAVSAYQVATAQQIASGSQAGDSIAVWSLEEKVRFVIPGLLFEHTQREAVSPPDSASATSVRPILIVGTKDALKGLDARTGLVLWSRPEYKNLMQDWIFPLPGTELALLETSKGEVVISLRTGDSLWHSRTLPFKDVKLYFPIPLTARFLLVGRDSSGRKTLANVGMADGKASWVRTDIWRHDPQCHGMAGKAQRSFLYHPPILDTDSTFILWLTSDGPVRLNFVTGSVAWVATSLVGKPVPMMKDGCIGARASSPWVVDRGKIYTAVPGRELAAIDVQSGAERWRVKVPAALGSFALVDSTSLLIQGWDDNGAAYLDRRALESGESFWAKPITGLQEASATFRGARGEVLLVAGGKVVAVSMHDGTTTPRDSLKFGSAERAVLFRDLPGLVALASEQNVAGVDTTGTVRYRARVLNPVKESERKLMSVFNTIGAIASAVSMVTSVYSYTRYYTGDHRAGLLAERTPTARRAVERLDQHYDDLLESAFANWGAVGLLEAQQRQMAAEVGLTTVTHEFAFFCTRDKTETGGQQWWLVQVSLGDGAEVARFPLLGMPSRVLLDQEQQMGYIVYEGLRLDALSLNSRARFGS